MAENSSTFLIPSFDREEAINFVEPADREVFHELNAIAEEIEQCRLNAR